MRTRTGICYPREEQEPQWKEDDGRRKRRRLDGAFDHSGGRLRRHRNDSANSEGTAGDRPDFFDGLPDDLVIFILCKLSASATCPADLISVMRTCRKFNGLVVTPPVLAKASSSCLAVKAKGWSESAHKFLKQCVDAGNLEACYILGMIRFYCLQNRGSGASLMARAAMGSHAAALYSLAVMQFNGSGGSKADKDLRAGVQLCARAAFLGHVNALRELGHCLQDGYGVRRNVTEGRRFLVQANARELAIVLKSTESSSAAWRRHLNTLTASGFSLLSDFGCNVPMPEAYPANQFMVEWFSERGVSGSSSVGVRPVEEEEEQGLRLCSHSACGRPETRKNEFRRCSVCGAVNYCSRACQAMHWKLSHKVECMPMERWLDAAAGGAAPVEGGHEMVMN